ncbi:helix-turn-helix domain-containing protein [Desulfovibrio sp. OttesenSCG-928-M16]|nr:helix-turn-helix domain-containing protein [Desulfovibrio sp. OttesenSCG-928-M16]
MNGPLVKTTFTLAEAADLLSCHRETLRRAILNGDLRAAKLGRGYRISRRDLEAFWKAGGGGDLFGSEADAVSVQPMPTEISPARVAKKKREQQQYSLPGTEQGKSDAS